MVGGGTVMVECGATGATRGFLIAGLPTFLPFSGRVTSTSCEKHTMYVGMLLVLWNTVCIAVKTNPPPMIGLNVKGLMNTIMLVNTHVQYHPLK